jgi:hypothetical protein
MKSPAFLKRAGLFLRISKKDPARKCGQDLQTIIKTFIT